MRLSIMQPYIFPYIGYFHLIEASDKIVFYDDVNYIKQGWINRNRTLSNGKELLFTVPLSNASSFTAIKDTQLNQGQLPKWTKKFLRTVGQSYAKAPFVHEVEELVRGVLESDHQSISDMAITSIEAVYQYLELELVHTRSSLCSPKTVDLNKADRIIRICEDLDHENYLNPIGGQELYDKAYFEKRGINLNFLQSEQVEYDQFKHEFVPALSMIDVLMFNDKESIRAKLGAYRIV